MDEVATLLDQVKELCKSHHVERLYLFGSALRPDYSDTSDLDFLVKFKPIDLSLYFDNYMGFKNRLKKLLKRDIDLLEEQALKNPILIKSINNSKELIYG